MNKDSIKATAVCRWDMEDECYVVSSPVMDIVLGVGDTEAEAWQIFNEILEETYQCYLEGRLANHPKPGRPAKHKVRIHAEISPDIKEAIQAMAKRIGISQGEVLEYLHAFYIAKA